LGPTDVADPPPSSRETGTSVDRPVGDVQLAYVDRNITTRYLAKK
jgi:hypothetical protein